MSEAEPAPGCVDQPPAAEGTPTRDIEGDDVVEPVIADELELPDGRYLIVYRRASSVADA